LFENDQSSFSDKAGGVLVSTVNVATGAEAAIAMEL
jgi:hypothetical protein